MHILSSGRVLFGAFELDLTTGELRSTATADPKNKILLREQVFQVMRMLLEREGQIVTREEIKNRLWADDTVVDFDHSINATIRALRRALEDSAENPRYIETLGRRGYRLMVASEWQQSESGIARGNTIGASPFSEPMGLGPNERDPSAERSMDDPRRVERQTNPYWWKTALLIASASSLVAFLIAGFFYITERPHVLTERDTIVLADFENRTGDPVFDYTLKQPLAVDLEQSPFLNVLSEEKVADTLRLMGHSPDHVLLRDLAQEVCQRTGSKAVVGGSIANLGSQYVVGLNAMNCQRAGS